MVWVVGYLVGVAALLVILSRIPDTRTPQQRRIDDLLDAQDPEAEILIQRMLRGEKVE